MKLITKTMFLGHIFFVGLPCFAAVETSTFSNWQDEDVKKSEIISTLDGLPVFAALESPADSEGKDEKIVKRKTVFTQHDTYPLSVGLMDVYQKAQKHDPVFQSAGFQRSAVDEGRTQAIAELLPKLIGSADYTKTYQDIESSDNNVVAAGDIDYNSTTFGLTLTQPIFHWDSIVGVGQSKAEILAAEVKYLVAENDLMIRVAELYFEALAALDQLGFAMAEQVAVEKHFELASGRFDMGLVPITDLHDAKARLASIISKTIEAENYLDDALQALQEVVGEPLEELKSLQEIITLVGPNPKNLDLWTEKAMKQNLGIKLQEYSVEVARLEVDKQGAKHYPTVDLIGRYENQDTDGSLYGGGAAGDTTDILVVLNVPFYEGGAVNSRVREAKHILSSARQELIKQQRAVIRQTRSAHLGVNSALKMIEALQQSVISTRLALDAKQEGFLSGIYTSLNVLDAERDLSLANIDYAKARYDYLLNNLKLKQAVGSLTAEDLNQLDQWLQ